MYIFWIYHFVFSGDGYSVCPFSCHLLLLISTALQRWDSGFAMMSANSQHLWMHAIRSSLFMMENRDNFWSNANIKIHCLPKSWVLLDRHKLNLNKVLWIHGDWIARKWHTIWSQCFPLWLWKQTEYAEHEKCHSVPEKRAYEQNGIAFTYLLTTTVS